MGFNHVSLNPIPINDPDLNLQQLAFGAAGVVGNATLAPAVAGKRISVHQMLLQVHSNAQANFIEVTPAGATVTFLIGSSNYAPIWPGNDTPVVLPWSQFPWFTTASGNAIAMAAAGAGTLFASGRLTFVQA